MKVLDKIDYSSVLNYYEMIKDKDVSKYMMYTVIDRNQSIMMSFGNVSLVAELDKDNIGVIYIRSLYFEKGKDKYIVPSLIRKEIEKVVFRLGKPLEKIDLSGDPIQILHGHV